MIRAVIFDCFGVIVGKGFDSTYAHAGGDPVRDEVFIKDMLAQANLGLITEDDFSNVMADHLDISLKQWHGSLEEAELADTALLEYVKGLRKKYKTGLLSNSNKGVLINKIGEPWLSDCFDVVVCSAEVGLVKPDLEIYKLTADKLGVQPNQCIFIDDHRSFVDAASKLGMQVILYKSFSSLKEELERLTSSR